MVQFKVIPPWPILTPNLIGLPDVVGFPGSKTLLYSGLVEIIIPQAKKLI